MTVERTAEEVVIRISSTIHQDDLQQVIDYLRDVETEPQSPLFSTDDDQLDFEKECEAGMSVEQFHQRMLTHIDGLPWKE
jgi:hypothetical protein